MLARANAYLLYMTLEWSLVHAAAAAGAAGIWASVPDAMPPFELNNW